MNAYRPAKHRPWADRLVLTYLAVAIFTLLVCDVYRCCRRRLKRLGVHTASKRR